MAETLIAKLEALKRADEHPFATTADYDEAVDDCIAIVKQQEAEVYGGFPDAKAASGLGLKEQPSTTELFRPHLRITEPVTREPDNSMAARIAWSEEQCKGQQVERTDESVINYSMLTHDELVTECKRLWNLSGRFLEDLTHERKEVGRLCDELLKRSKELTEALMQRIPEREVVDDVQLWRQHLSDYDTGISHFQFKKILKSAGLLCKSEEQERQG